MRRWDFLYLADQSLLRSPDKKKKDDDEEDEEERASNSLSSSQQHHHRNRTNNNTFDDSSIACKSTNTSTKTSSHSSNSSNSSQFYTNIDFRSPRGAVSLIASSSSSSIAGAGRYHGKSSTGNPDSTRLLDQPHSSYHWPNSQSPTHLASFKNNNSVSGVEAAAAAEEEVSSQKSGGKFIFNGKNHRHHHSINNNHNGVIGVGGGGQVHASSGNLRTTTTVVIPVVTSSASPLRSNRHSAAARRLINSSNNTNSSGIAYVSVSSSSNNNSRHGGGGGGGQGLLSASRPSAPIMFAVGNYVKRMGAGVVKRFSSSSGGGSSNINGGGSSGGGGMMRCCGVDDVDDDGNIIGSIEAGVTKDGAGALLGGGGGGGGALSANGGSPNGTATMSRTGSMRSLRSNMDLSDELGLDKEAEKAGLAAAAMRNGLGKGDGRGGLKSNKSLGRGTGSSIGCCRASVVEVAGFLLWVLCIVFELVQIPMVWYVFWEYIANFGPASSSEEDSPHQAGRRSLPLWLLWILGLYYYRRAFKRKANRLFIDLMKHGEIMISSSLFMTLCVNFASFVHVPGPRLFDIGFLVIPEQGVHSPWRPVSDIMTVALPIVALIRSLWCDRTTRCILVTSWLRLISVVYLFRCLTVALTSLPGPAPHCETFDKYNPPKGWHDIATRLGPMTGDFSTCGDLIFSGHTAWTTITMLVVVKSFRGLRGYKLVKLAGMLYLMTMCVLSIAGRKHYTVDIALGIMIASLTFFRFQNGWGFHHHAQQQQQQQQLLTSLGRGDGGSGGGVSCGNGERGGAYLRDTSRHGGGGGNKKDKDSLGEDSVLGLLVGGGGGGNGSGMNSGGGGVSSLMKGGIELV